MKCQRFNLVAAGLLAAGLMAIGAFAQRLDPPAPSPTVRGDTVLGESLSKRLAHMTKRYKLTAEQQSRIRSIFLHEQQDMQVVNSDRFMSHRDRLAEMSNVHEANQQKIRTLLSGSQQHRFDADERRRAWMDGRLPNPNPGPF
jgi:Spy/CpxP family protein refolding chaperone